MQKVHDGWNYLYLKQKTEHIHLEGAGKVSGQNTGNSPPLEVTLVFLPQIGESRDLLVKRDRGHLSRNKAENTFYFPPNGTNFGLCVVTEQSIANQIHRSHLVLVELKAARIRMVYINGLSFLPHALV